MISNKQNQPTASSRAGMIGRRAVSTLCAVILVSASNASLVMAAVPAKKASAVPKQTSPAVHVKKGPRTLTRVNQVITLPPQPTDNDIESNRALRETLVPKAGAQQPGENAALAVAINSFSSHRNPENLQALENFATNHKSSRWSPALKLNLGLLRYETGYLSESLKVWREVWNESKDDPSRQNRAIAERAFAEMVLLEARLGKTTELQNDLAAIAGRKLEGSAEQKVDAAKVGLHCMKGMPERSFKCGPYAVNCLYWLNKRQPMTGTPDVIEKFPSAPNGTNLKQVRDLSTAVGLKYQAAKRVGSAPYVVPSVMHWKLGHFSAITAYENGKYKVQDPTFDLDSIKWISAKALDAETDGYFLIPSGTLPGGWKAVSDDEAGSVWGRGAASGWAMNQQGAGAPTTSPGPPGGCPAGMAQAQAKTMTGTLNIFDTPLTYSPPVGPRMDFHLNWNQLEVNQPTTFTFPNFGTNWNFNWVAWMTLDASNNATVMAPGGGAEIYKYNNSTTPYPNRDLISQAKLKYIASNSYQRLLPDGSIEKYNQADGSGKIFMTEFVDPQGNSVLIQYDSNFRITSITDAIGQVSTLTYVSNSSGNSGYYKIAAITDPFSRSCTFAYDSGNTRLISITDVVGLVSEFHYDTSSDFINALTTPYGSTGFTSILANANPTSRSLMFNFPDQTYSFLLAKLEGWTTYFWDRHATGMSTAAYLNPSDATQSAFVMDPSTEVVQAVSESVKIPSTIAKTDYSYPGQTGAQWLGSIGQPTGVNFGGRTQSYTYNSFGHVTEYVDEVGRKFTFVYDTNDIDLLEMKQTRGTNHDYLGQWQSYNSQHLPASYVDGSGQTASYTYNSFGEVLTITDPNSDVTTMTYDSDGYLTSIDGPLSGSQDITTLTYDGYGRVQTVTNSQGYVLTYSYDALNRLTAVTYPDGTAEKTVYDKMDAVLISDRLGRWTQRAYDSLDQLAYEVDPLGRKTQYGWCYCGALRSLTDPAGHVTSWSHDMAGRPTSKTYPDGTTVRYEYNNYGEVHYRDDAMGQRTPLCL